MDARLGQQLLNLALRAGVLALAELLIPDVSLGIDKIESWPKDVVERIPDRVFIVNRNGIVDVHLSQRGANIIHVLLEIKLRSVYPNHNQTLRTVFCIPCADIRQRSSPIDTGIGPKLDDHYLPSH